MSIYREERTGNWVVKVRDLSGRQHTVTLNQQNMVKYGLGYCPNITSRVAHHLEWAVLTKFNSGNGNHTGQYALAEIVQRFLDTRAVSKSYRYRLQLSVKQYFLKFIGNCSINNIGIEDIQRFRVFLTNNHCPETIRDYMVDLKYFLHWAKKCGYLDGEYLSDIKLPPHTRKAIEYLTPEQAQILIKCIKGLPIEMPAIGIINLGLRRGELINLEWRDINFEKNMVRVRGTKTSNAIREVPLPRSLKERLLNLPRISNYIFANENGAPLTESMLASGLRRFKARNLSPFNWTFQMLRRTYGSILVSRGVPMEYVSLYLGHSDLRVTQQWYVGLRPSDYAEKVSLALDGLT